MEQVARGAFTLVALTALIGAMAALAVIQLASLDLDRETKRRGAFLGVVIYDRTPRRSGRRWPEPPGEWL